MLFKFGNNITTFEMHPKLQLGEVLYEAIFQQLQEGHQPLPQQM